ncbi:MAG: fatty acid desaturase, partial [Hymenobacter sp.]
MAPAPLAGRGVLAAALILAAWAGLLAYLLAFYRPDWHSPAPYLLVLLQMHLYTGLYITAHDAMHGVVSPNKALNNTIGTVCALLFAYNWFP